MRIDERVARLAMKGAIVAASITALGGGAGQVYDHWEAGQEARANIVCFDVEAQVLSDVDKHPGVARDQITRDPSGRSFETDDEVGKCQAYPDQIRTELRKDGA